MHEVSPLSLVFTYGLVILFLFLAAWQRLGIAKDVFWASLRGTLQLIGIAFGITWIFKVDHPGLIAGVVLVMGGIATQVAFTRVGKIKGIRWVLALAILSTTFLVLGFLTLVGAIEWSGRFVIPIAGILVGQVMAGSSLFLERLLSDLKAQRLLLESNLALGATPHQAMNQWVRSALKADSIPTVDMLKTLGLIHLPGMMSGLIIAGADPLLAVKYQLIVIFMLVFGFGFSSLILASLIPPFLLNRDLQLREW